MRLLSWCLREFWELHFPSCEYVSVPSFSPLCRAFFWLVSLLLTSLIWVIIPPLKTTPAFHLPFSVLLQELFRWLLYRLLRSALWWCTVGRHYGYAKLPDQFVCCNVYVDPREFDSYSCVSMVYLTKLPKQVIRFLHHCMSVYPCPLFSSVHGIVSGLSLEPHEYLIESTELALSCDLTCCHIQASRQGPGGC